MVTMKDELKLLRAQRQAMEEEASTQEAIIAEREKIKLLQNSGKRRKIQKVKSFLKDISAGIENATKDHDRDPGRGIMGMGDRLESYGQSTAHSKKKNGGVKL